ncbi:Uma2 family endonuclease [Dolichospermum circinale CS-1225]|uniref:Uma2 family endonuclease n=1 Tax=Dolichospermum circinale TaxID=109265 RepID=UPI0004225CDA|nr:Uma2 family endonuclease [Dolichospermum circinale]MDB9522751.1 Uma2 family endonuclease [Dolichospermum circinale CS-1225]
MTQVKIKLTVEEFLALPENDTTYEFVDGEAIPKYKNQQMSPKFFHGSTTGALFILFIILSTWAQAKGRVVVEWAIKLTKNQEIWIPVPDLTYVSYHRLSADWLEDEACPVIPELVMEIISPGQTFGDMIEKAIYYLQAGILLVWIVDTISQTITVFTQSSLPATFREHQIITHEILPGLEITPHTIFRAMV